MRWFSQGLRWSTLLIICLVAVLLFAQPAFAQASSVAEPDQSAAISKIVEISKQSQPPKLRGQHPKGHGTVWAEFTVAPDLSQNLRVGVFQEPGKTYPAWIRFSNARDTDDTKPGLQGMAIKLMDVAGDKVLESEKTAQTQDFVMVNHPVFFIRNASDFAEFFTALATGKQSEFFKTHQQEAKITQSLQTKQTQNPLAAQYWSTTPYQFGETAIKFAVRPTSQIGDEMGNTPDYLRAAMANSLMAQDATFDFLIQQQNDAAKTPIEDPTVEWHESDAPLQKVATIRIPRQIFDTPEQNAFGEALSFTPWHSLPEHQPLGSINRARKAIYQATSEQRHREMEIAVAEPTPDTFTPRLLNP
ncbi:catalase family protein [Leptolyngbya sp. NK1-12]|uniref:Catalase family protein n=1 Tax=Leptolyngbya sp. NK1-12 TaxID=2547451 RepID=A0AA97AK43_9CYAN|nr:catalase family protein [Leptolyngbya sp. NK1-12]WNZ23312.1 catalase family protein [Leptolyngbya sp. NK1-12]